MLNTIHYGTPGGGPSLLIAHGLFGSARNWGVIAKRLSAHRHVVAVDMRNHGHSPWYDSHSYQDMADDLSQVISELPAGRADVLGHSMGGKATMMLALTNPRQVERLIVADIAPVTYSHTQSHLIDAMRRVDLANIANRSEAITQLSVNNSGVSSFLLQSLDLKEKRWRINLDVLEAEMPGIIGFPNISAQFSGKSLFLSGELSEYVGLKHKESISDLFLNEKYIKLRGAGHWLHADKPREFEAIVNEFLTRSDANSG